MPALDGVRLAALRQVGREWDRTSAARPEWRQALLVDPTLGETAAGADLAPGARTLLDEVYASELAELRQLW